MIKPSPAARREWAACALRRARRSAQPVLLSISHAIAAPEDVLALVAAGGESSPPYGFLWQHPAEQFALAAAGVAADFRATGSNRFRTIAAAWAELVHEAVIGGEAAAAGPIVTGGFSFAPEPPPDEDWHGFPPGRMVLPQISVLQQGQSATLTVNLLVEGAHGLEDIVGQIEARYAKLRFAAAAPMGSRLASSPPECAAAAAQSPAAWRAAAGATIADIASGRLDKLVLARDYRLRSTRAFESARIVARLRQAHPNCTTFWIATPNGSFLGATPERLVRLADGVVCSAALAGTSARGVSSALDRALLDNGKERHEHALVVRAIAAALTPLCDSLTVPAAPQVLALENLQHLFTPISGTLRAQCSVLELVERLHPTPAVAGYPRAAALALLTDREAFNRGWYAGPIGWINARQEGEFAVALRSALVRGDRAALFAGAGIVAGSDPDAELAETELKLQPLLAALLEV
ncbi:MAG: isochorismate synthase [Deltaproteobacteria bacterium]|nr:isochorismate synthase [Deltaproteobacteria bacterium]